MIIDMEDLQLGLSMLALTLDEIHLQIMPNGTDGVVCFVNWVATKEEALGFKIAEIGHRIDIALPECDLWLDLNQIDESRIEEIHEDTLVDLRYKLCTGQI